MSEPTVVCLCGSTRFGEAFAAAGWTLTLLDQIVLSIGVCKHADPDGAHGGEVLGQDVAERLDRLHLRKIDMADWVLVLNIAGYYGQSTEREIEYARKSGKPVVMLTDKDRPCDVPDWRQWETWTEVEELAKQAAKGER